MLALYESVAAEHAPVDRLRIPLLGTVPAVDPFRRPVRPYVFHLRKGDEFEIAKIARHLTYGNY